MGKFTVSEEFWDKFPDAMFGVIYGSGLDNSNENSISKMARIDRTLKSGVVQINKYLAKPDFAENKVIKAWRDAYAGLGEERIATSMERLFHEALDTGLIEKVNVLVDLANSVSLIWALPLSVFDTSKASSEITMEIQGGIPRFYGKGSMELSPIWGADEHDTARVHENTKNALIVINLCDPSRDMEVAASLKTLTNQVGAFLGGSAVSGTVKAGNVSFEF
ncbi:MAG: hypothetical protein FWG10_12500 [Eubacteriaceae bacterium]|nr:hypothetical protein [Eubacteriaceae bacterium]